MPAIFQALFQFVWFVTKWCLALAVLGALVTAAYIYHRADEEVRRRAEEMVAAHYADFAVHLRSAKFVAGEGIELRGLSISRPGGSADRAELVVLDEVLIEAPVTWQELLTQQLRVSRIIIRRPSLNVTRLEDGAWNIDGLLPLPRFGPQSPEVVIEGGTTTVVDLTASPPRSLVCRDVEIKLSPARAADEPALGLERKLEGTLIAQKLGQVAFSGRLATDGALRQLHGTVTGLELTPETYAILPGDAPSLIDWSRSLRARTDFTFRLDREEGETAGYRYALEGTLRRGQIEDPRLPFLLTDVEAHYVLDDAGFAIERLTGRQGHMKLDMSCRSGRPGTAAELEVRAKFEQLHLDTRLRDALPEPYRSQWHKFLPAGLVDVDLTASYVSGEWIPKYRIACRDVSFTHHMFPYRLERGRGIVEGDDDECHSQITAYAGGEEVYIVADVHGSPDDAFGVIDVRGHRLPIDQKLFAALPETTARPVRAFNPRGTFNVAMRLTRDDPAQPAFERKIDISLNRISIRYEHFPYPLTNVRGSLREQDGQWTFHRVEGNNDSALVMCDGYLTLEPGGHELVLDMTARELALDDELRSALDYSSRALWHELRPRGSIDVTAHVRHTSSDLRPDVKLVIHPRGEETSIEPRFFPFRMENLRGLLTHHRGHTELIELRSRHGQVEMLAKGSCRVEEDGSWRLKLDRLDVDRLRFDHDLRRALPEQLRKNVQKLDPQGPVYLRGSLELAGGRPQDASGDGTTDAAPQEATWNIGFGLHQTGLQLGSIRLSRVNGTATLRGRSDGRHFRCAGELDLDSVIYDKVQLTEVRGPVWIDEEVVLFGAEAARRAREPEARHLTAKAYGGTLVADAWMRQTADSQFAVQAILTDADMRRVAQEVFTGPQDLSGTMTAGIQLHGTNEGRHSLAGHGYVRLRDADIYRLPQMVALLKILSVRSPDTVAFTESDVDFWIQAGHVYFDRMNFNGDAVSLIGTGQMNLDAEIDLTFYGIVGRDRLNVPILGDLFRGASQQIMLVRAEGKLADPIIRNEPFPGVNQALAQLQNELERRPQQFRLLPPLLGPAAAARAGPANVQPTRPITGSSPPGRLAR